MRQQLLKNAKYDETFENYLFSKLFNRCFLLHRQKYHQNDIRLPIFSVLPSQSRMSKKEKEKSVAETLTTLAVEPPSSSQICSILPRNVMQNRAFIVDTSRLKDVADVLADDTGSWINNGQHKFHYERNEEDHYERVGRKASFDTSRLGRQWITLHRHYYYNRDANDFHRIVSFVTGKQQSVCLPDLRSKNVYQRHT